MKSVSRPLIASVVGRTPKLVSASAGQLSGPTSSSTKSAQQGWTFQTGRTVNEDALKDLKGVWAAAGLANWKLNNKKCYGHALTAVARVLRQSWFFFLARVLFNRGDSTSSGVLSNISHCQNSQDYKIKAETRCRETSWHETKNVNMQVNHQSADICNCMCLDGMYPWHVRPLYNLYLIMATGRSALKLEESKYHSYLQEGQGMPWELQAGQHHLSLWEGDGTANPENNFHAQKRWPFPLFNIDEATPGVPIMFPFLSTPVQERHRHTGESPVEGHQDAEGTEAPLPLVRESGDCSACRREGLGGSYQCVWIPQGRVQRRLNQAHFQWCPVVGEEAMGTSWNTKSSIWTSASTALRCGWWSTVTGCPERL